MILKIILGCFPTNAYACFLWMLTLVILGSLLIRQN